YVLHVTSRSQFLTFIGIKCKQNTGYNSPRAGSTNGLNTLLVPGAHCTTGLKSANTPSAFSVHAHTCMYQMLRLSSCFSFWPMRTGGTESRAQARYGTMNSTPLSRYCR